jgi:TFIIF-interacting CTD phosphatase-like protein
MLGSLTTRAKSLFAVAVLILIAAVMIYFGPDLSEILAPRSDGHIIVNSPSIYTRQRLVNDRLEHSAWLKDQLKVTLEQLKQ